MCVFFADFEFMMYALYRASQARLVLRESKVMLVKQEPGDPLDPQESRERKEEGYAHL